MRVVFPESFLTRGKQLRVGLQFSIPRSGIKARAEDPDGYSYEVVGPSIPEPGGDPERPRRVQEIREIAYDASLPGLPASAKLGSIA